MISFLSVSGHVAKTGAGIVDQISERFLGGEKGANAARNALGLDKSLPQMWGRDSFIPGWKPPGSTTAVPDTPGSALQLDIDGRPGLAAPIDKAAQ